MTSTTRVATYVPSEATVRWTCWIGVALGIAGAWVALPPIHARSWYLSLVLCLIAVLIGAMPLVRGVERRLGGFAVASGVLGFTVAYLATRSSFGKLEAVVVWSALVAAMLRAATPLTFAAIGGMFSERSGVVNIGLEGMMLMGAFFSVLVADKADSWPLGLVAGMLAGGVTALVHAFFSIHLRADQIVTGTAIILLATGLTGYFYFDVYGEQGTPSDIPTIPSVHLGFLDDLYFIGPVFSDMNLMIWLAILLVVVSWVVMFKTPIGLRIRSVGEHPRAADTVGIDVYAVRYAAVVLSGMLAALGGAYLSIGFVASFSVGIISGRGFIALAALIFGNWRPWQTAAACLLFGFSQALGQRLPEYSDSAAVLFSALPYVLTLIAVAGVIGRTIPPAAVGRPYKKQ